MADFPTTILRPSSLKDLAPEDPAIRTEMENGMVQTRARFTRIRKSWTLTWSLIKESDYQTLVSHWEEQKGGSDSFSWTHWLSGKTYEVRYKEMSEAETIGAGWRRGFSVTLEEV